MTSYDIEINNRKAFDPDSRYMIGDESDDDQDSPSHPLDTPQQIEKLSKLKNIREQAKIAQAENRLQMAIDEDYYDSIQWSDEDKAEVEGRGQAALVYNEIKPAMDWIIGTQKRAKVDWKVHPRTDDDRDEAENKTKLLKYVSDVNRIQFHRSEAFKEAVKAGVSWLEDGVRSDPTDEMLFSRHESWRNIWYDHLGMERDTSDWRYLIREKWVDLDVAIAMWPDREAQLRSSAITTNLYGNDDDESYYLSALYYQTDSQGYALSRRSVIDDVHAAVHNRRERVRLVEMWYREPERVKIMRGNYYSGGYINEESLREIMNHEGGIYSPNDQSAATAVQNGYITLFDAVRMRVKCAIFPDNGNYLLQDLTSPYKHERFPFTPVWGYRRARDNAPYGAIRQCRDPQDDLNKRHSKAQYILATNKIIMEKDAVEDKEELREEAADPAGIIEKKRGYELELINDKQLAEEHIMLARMDGEYIRHIGGVTGENLGQETNATSGRAIMQRQLQGAVVTTELFDNLRFSIQLQGESQLSLLEQYYDFPKIIRIIGDRGKQEFVGLNMPKGTNGEIENPITRAKADFVVDAQDFRESVRLAMFEQLLEMLGKLPVEVGIQLLDLVIDMSDIPGKDEFVRRIRAINGQTDPDDPDQAEQTAAADEAKREAARIEKEAVEAEIRDKRASAAQKEATAHAKTIEAIQKALEVALQTSGTPNLAPAADSILESARPVTVGGNL